MGILSRLIGIATPFVPRAPHKILVKIKRDSIRRNTKRRVANQPIPILVRQTITMTINSAENLLPENGYFDGEMYPGAQVVGFGTTVPADGPPMHRYDVLIDTPEHAADFSEWLKSKSISHVWNLSNQHENVYSMFDDPLWLFEYEDPTITCCHCGNKCKVSQLRFDWIEDDGYGDAINGDNICPHCHKDDCVIVEREEIDDALCDLAAEVDLNTIT